MKREALRQIPFFAALPDDEIAHLAGALRSCDFAAKTILLQEGQADDHFYVLLEGEVEVIKALATADERVLGVRQAPCLLGEMSLFSVHGGHTASVRARGAVHLLQITRADLDALLQRQPGLAYSLIHLLSTRLEEAENSTILDLREKNRQLREAFLELQAAQAQLVEKERLERELEIARGIQLSVLPPALPKVPGFDIGAVIHPARAVGGDFYDVIPLGSGRIGMVVGDVCDKGVPAALFMMRTYSLLRAKAGHHSVPADVLRAVNRHLLTRNPSGMFVTLFYGILDGASARLAYARAGHPLPIVLDRSGQAVALSRKAGQPLGLWQHPLLDEADAVIPQGGVALVFSDGLSEGVEQQEDSHSLERLCAGVAARQGMTAQGLCDGLWQEIVSSSSARQRDDFVVLAIKRDG